MNDRIRRLMIRAQTAASLEALNGRSTQDAMFYAVCDEITEVEREKECALAEAESLRAKVKELEQRSTIRTKLNLFRNIKFLNINKLINNEKD